MRDRPDECDDPLLMSLVKISVDGQVKEGFLSLKKNETWIVYVCHSEGEWARQQM